MSESYVEIANLRRYFSPQTFYSLECHKIYMKYTMYKNVICIFICKNSSPIEVNRSHTHTHLQYGYCYMHDQLIRLWLSFFLDTPVLVSENIPLTLNSVSQSFHWMSVGSFKPVAYLLLAKLQFLQENYRTLSCPLNFSIDFS